MIDGELALLAWSDYVGITRCRGVPVAEMDDRLRNGLGWAVAGQALTPFGEIAPNPWGPMDEVRQIPVPATRTRVDIWDDAPAYHFYLCDSVTKDGQDWDCCTRAFMRSALDDLKSETGLDFVAAFEHEFTILGEGLLAGPPFSVAAMRGVAAFTSDLARALLQAGVGPETIEPEYGILQFEVTTAPTSGAAAGDRAIITRDVIREVARRRGIQACFSPKPTPDGVGNGAHVHFSLADDTGANASYDANGFGGASLVAQRFIAGVMQHMPALTALVAPSPVSYLRLGPHNWSCGYASFGVQNREAAIRICPSPDRDPQRCSKAFNMEFRPPDPTANPYMVIGALVRAGLDGIRNHLPMPAACDRDPAELTAAERAELGIVSLPMSLGEALTALTDNPVAAGWLSPTMLESYLSVKRTEIALTADQTPEEMCAMYARAY
jgi:glutamine synthetase